MMNKEIKITIVKLSFWKNWSKMRPKIKKEKKNNSNLKINTTIIFMIKNNRSTLKS
jgi:hypothetical protein